MKSIYRGRILTFHQDTDFDKLLQIKPHTLFIDKKHLTFIRDGALIVENGIITKIDDFHKIKHEITTEDDFIDYGDAILTPGFIDMHIHTNQTSVASYSGKDIVKWLDEQAFPTEIQFRSEEYAKREYTMLLKQLFKNGTTSIVGMLPSYYDTADLMFEITDSFSMRAILGNTIMTEGHPALTTNPESGILISEHIYSKWHGVNRLSYSLSPRFALSCNEMTFALCSQFLKTHPNTYFHTHLAESIKESVDSIKKFPDAKDNLAIYEQYNLINDKSIFAHCLHLTENEYHRLEQKKAIIVNCPSSNNYMGSGSFDYSKLDHYKFRFGFGSDWGAGNTLSMLRVMDDAHKLSTQKEYHWEPLSRWYLATLGAARALGLEKYIGSLETGKEADFIVIDPSQNELLLHRLESSYDLLDYLFNLCAFGDDRIIIATYIFGNKVYGI